MADSNSNIFSLMPMQPLSSTAPVKRRVNFYFAKPKERTLIELKNETLIAPKSLLETSFFRMHAANNFVDKNFKPQLNGLEIEKLTNCRRETGLSSHSQTAEYYPLKLDKNFDRKVHALINEIDSKSPILLRNSLLTEDPIAWQRQHPFTKIPAKRSLTIESANFLQYNEPLSAAAKYQKIDFLE